MSPVLRARRVLVALLAGGAVLAASLTPALAVGLVGDPGDDNITSGACVRHDGGTDQAIDHCNDPGSDDTPVDPSGGDVDPNDGGSARQANEPFVIFDPTDSNTLIAGWNDYSMSDLGAGWQGFGYSRDGGETWIRSYVPGYPADTSVEGQQSPLYGNNTEAGDPIAAFDGDGNLYVGGISFNRGGAINGHVYVARYDAADVVIDGPDYPADYRFTRIVGRGTPSRNFQGIFQDKPLLEVDRTGGEHDGNVYVCWSRFTGFGQNKIFFSRSTDGGDTYSKPFQVSVHGHTGSVQGCDIAVEGDGDLYLTFRTFADPSTPADNALYFVRSTDGGASFARAEKILDITPYFPFDSARDCGDGPFECPMGYVFARTPLEPRVTADQSSATDGLWLIYNEVDPDTIVPSEPGSSYSSAGGGLVGRSVVYVVSSTNNGQTWSSPLKVDNAGGLGHQFFPDIDALGGVLAAVWQDSRTDQCYSVQRPIGNDEDATACDNDNVVNTFLATSSDGGSSWSSIKISDVGHQPNYEMFGSRDIPFQGDYNWVSIAATGAGLHAYAAWTDNRNVVEGEDPREAEQDGFDVLQCRIDLGAEAATGSGTSGYNGPRARTDAPFSGDNCGNGGGLDQDIFGNRVSVP